MKNYDELLESNGFVLVATANYGVTRAYYNRENKIYLLMYESNEFDLSYASSKTRFKLSSGKYDNFEVKFDKIFKEFLKYSNILKSFEEGYDR